MNTYNNFKLLDKFNESIKVVVFGRISPQTPTDALSIVDRLLCHLTHQ